MPFEHELLLPRALDCTITILGLVGRAAEGEGGCRGKMEEDDVMSDLGDDHGRCCFAWMASL